MEKSLNKPRLVRRVSPRDTLLSMYVGETIRIPTREVKTPAVRTAAHRIEKKREGKFYVTEQGLIDETQVTRLK